MMTHCLIHTFSRDCCAAIQHCICHSASFSHLRFVCPYGKAWRFNSQLERFIAIKFMMKCHTMEKMEQNQIPTNTFVSQVQNRIRDGSNWLFFIGSFNNEWYTYLQTWRISLFERCIKQLLWESKSNLSF